MKKFTSILCAAAVFANLAALTGCNSGGTSDNSGDSQLSSPVSDSTGNTDNSDGAGSSDNSDSAPEPKKPDGEPTFLIGLDGEPVYTSEISEIYNFDRETLEYIRTETLDRESFSRGVCESFTYGYIPRMFVNFIDNPELFEDSDKTGFYFYCGEELPDSGEFIRINVGDKFGDLTVKTARSVFDRRWNGFDEFYGSGYIEFDGEVELTGYVNVVNDSEFYLGTGGEIWFFPDQASSIKIPNIAYERNYDNGTARRRASFGIGTYGEAVTLWIGNIDGIDSEFRVGDENVKVKVTVKNIALSTEGGQTAVIKDIELV